MQFGLGQPVRRKEDARFLTGRGTYVDDLRLPGALHAVALRSPHAHARILGVDTAAARAMPGVALVYAGADVAGRLAPLAGELPLTQSDGRPAAPAALPHLATERALWAGQPVAFVVAETPAQARDAAEAVVVTYAPLPAVVDPLAALAEGAPRLHPEAPGNLAYDWALGDAAAAAAGFARAAHVARVRVVNQRLVVASMEPRAIAARFDAATGRWEIWVGSQGVHSIRARIAAALKVRPERLRVHTPDVGGGFGMKLMAHPEYGLCALAAQDAGRPVRWSGERSDAMLGDAQGRDLTTEAEGAFDAEGRILAFRWSSVSNLGAGYSSFGAGIHTVFSAPLTGGMYRVPALHHRVRGAFTTTTPTDAYRGAGRPEMIYVTERLMEEAARGMGMDPVALRLANLVTPAELPHATAGGMRFDSLDPATNVRRAVAAADREGFPARRAEAAARGRLRGLGVAYYMERTGGGLVERAELTVTPEGRGVIRVGTQSTGQGHETVWAQIVHERLGLDWSAVDLLPGDSDALAAGGGTGGSRSLIMAGRVLFLAADAVIEKARALAAEKLEAAAADIVFSAAEGGLFRVAGTDRTVRLVALAAEAGGIDGTGAVNDREATYPNGCHVAEVEIDPETGRLEVVRYTVVDDFGRVANPLLAEGQVQGGVAQGLGQALMEAMRWHPETGQPLTASLMDYALPRAADMPAVEAAFNEAAPTPTNPLGVKGCGEAGAVAATPAVTLAALDALRAAGVTEALDTPLTPERVWRALSAAKDGGRGNAAAA
jgi:carbon-monoxide dehydrogenase large subunit